MPGLTTAEKEGRYNAMDRVWSVAFYLAAAPRSCTVAELMALVEWKWTRKTLRRDLDFWVRFGAVNRFHDSEHQLRYKWVGSKKPFFRVGQLYCHTCHEFKATAEFIVLKGNYYPVCIECNRMRQREWYHRNVQYARARQKNARIKQILKESEEQDKRRQYGGTGRETSSK